MSGGPHRSVAVFGGSDVPAGHPIYEMAREVGSRLARRGFQVVSGGYGGVMEGASRGAREAGGDALGVTTDVFSAGRGGGNPYLSEEIREPDLLGRMRTLIGRSDGFVVLPGKEGTLAELAALWALHRAGVLGRRPVVLLGACWDGLVDELERRGLAEPARREVTLRARSAAEAVDLVALALETWQDSGPGGPQG